MKKAIKIFEAPLLITAILFVIKLYVMLGVALIGWVRGDLLKLHK